MGGSSAFCFNPAGSVQCDLGGEPPSACPWNEDGRLVSHLPESAACWLGGSVVWRTPRQVLLGDLLRFPAITLTLPVLTSSYGV